MNFDGKQAVAAPLSKWFHLEVHNGNQKNYHEKESQLQKQKHIY